MNIIDYVNKFGDKTFLEEPFRDSDALVLSQIVYLNFNLICEKFIFNKPEHRYLLKDLLDEKYTNILLVYNSIMEKNLYKFIEPIKKSRRFGELEIGYIQSTINKIDESQFFALTYFLPNGTLFLAFRGTDATLTGWKEDLNMAHMNIVPSQIKANLYVNAVLSYEKDVPFYIGGHSKGGNLAYYAAMKMDDRHVPNLIRVYNLDGPGFKHPDVIFDPYRKRIVDKVCLKTIPHRSLVGILLHHDIDSKIVKSTQLYLLQHDLFSWVIDSKSKDLVYLSRRSLISRVNEKTMKQFLNEFDDAEIKEIADALLEMLGGHNYTVYDLARNPLNAIHRWRHIYRRYDKNKRTRLFKTIALLFKHWSVAVITVGFKGEK